MQETREYKDGEERTKLALKTKRTMMTRTTMILMMTMTTARTIVEAKTKHRIVCARRITTEGHNPFSLAVST
jgi:hypothetical protein